MTLFLAFYTRAHLQHWSCSPHWRAKEAGISFDCMHVRMYVGVDYVPVGGAAGDSISIVTAIGRAIGQRSSSPDFPLPPCKQLFGRIAIIIPVV